MKNTYWEWVNKEGKPMTGKYYLFKSRKVRRAYMHWTAEELDRIGYQVLHPTYDASTQMALRRFYTNYADNYK